MMGIHMGKATCVQPKNNTNIFQVTMQSVNCE